MGSQRDQETGGSGWERLADQRGRVARQDGRVMADGYRARSRMDHAAMVRREAWALALQARAARARAEAAFLCAQATIASGRAERAVLRARKGPTDPPVGDDADPTLRPPRLP